MHKLLHQLFFVDLAFIHHLGKNPFQLCHVILIGFHAVELAKNLSVSVRIQNDARLVFLKLAVFVVGLHVEKYLICHLVQGGHRVRCDCNSDVIKFSDNWLKLYVVYPV